MDLSVADAIASVGRNDIEISSILPHGITPGSKLIMKRERAAAEEAIKSGNYVIWRSLITGKDCARVGLRSRCFCGCLFQQHRIQKNATLPICMRCECRGFEFVPSRPEEIGEWWLPRRPGFDASTWRANCRCGHSHESHHPVRRTCDACRCSEFSSAYGCIVCNAYQEDHQTRFESAGERASAGRAVGPDFIPLSRSPQISRLALGGRGSRSHGAMTTGRSKSGASNTTDHERNSARIPRKQEDRIRLSTSAVAVVEPRNPGHRYQSCIKQRPPTPSIGNRLPGGSITSRRASGIEGDGDGDCDCDCDCDAAASSKQGMTAGKMLVLKGRPAGVQQDGERRQKDNAGYGDKDDTVVSPEDMVSSGKISASGYHELLAKLDNRR